MADFKLPPTLPGIVGDMERRLSALERPRGTRYSEALGEVSTASTSRVNLDGPSVTVSVPSGGAFVSFLVDVELKNDTSGQFAFVSLTTPVLLDVANSDGTPNYVRVQSKPHAAEGSIWPRGGWVTFHAEPGELTLAVQYRAGSGGTAYFRNRRLWVKVG